MHKSNSIKMRLLSCKVSTLHGEDSQIYSKEEIVEQFELFNTNIGDDVDKSLELLKVIRDFRTANQEDYERIKELPIKSRTARSLAESGKSIAPNSSLVYVASPFKKEFYWVDGKEAIDMGFLDVISLFEANRRAGLPLPDIHYSQVSRAAAKFDSDVVRMLDDSQKHTPSEKDKVSDKAKKFLRMVWRLSKSRKVQDATKILEHYVELGTYSRLTRELSRMEGQYAKAKISLIEVENAISGYLHTYHTRKNEQEET